MQKRGRVNVLLPILLLSMLFITACGFSPAAGDSPPDTAAALKQVQSGTQGVKLEIDSNLPPSILYDDTELVALVEVKNKGNYDILPQQCFVHPTGFDKNIIRGLFSRSCAEGLTSLEGKNVYNTEGDFNQLEFTAPNIELPVEVFEYNPTLNFVTCYQYRTVANPEVCVDPLFYEVSSEQKVCKPQDVSLGGGQGAPVGVSYVGVDMVGDRAIFEINVRNFGSGRILSPFTDIQSCTDRIEYQDLDRVSYDVRLSGGSMINCKPQDRLVRMSNGQGKIVCSFNINSASAFTTPLEITLDYNYMESYQKKVKIISTPE